MRHPSGCIKRTTTPTGASARISRRPQTDEDLAALRPPCLSRSPSSRCWDCWCSRTSTRRSDLESNCASAPMPPPSWSRPRRPIRCAVLGPGANPNLLASVVHKHQVRYAAVTDHRERLLAEAGQRAEPATFVEVVRSRWPIRCSAGSRCKEWARAETGPRSLKPRARTLIIAGLAMGLVAFISLTLGLFPHAQPHGAGARRRTVRQGITPRASACGHATRSAISPRASMTWRRG